jgi:glycine cleavage system H lipoate-binding protein
MTVLFVVATITLFLGIDWLVQYSRRRKAQEASAAIKPVSLAYPLRIPEGVFFARSHTWLNLFPSGRVRLGIDDFVGSMLAHPEVSFMRSTGEHVEKGDPLISLSEGDRHLIIRAPIAGEIVAINNDLVKNPELMRDKLFSDGWAFTLQPKGVEDMRALLLGEESRHWMADEFRRLRDMAAGLMSGPTLAPAVLQDGGAPAPGMLHHLDASGWKRFEAEFLQVR